LLIYYDDGKEEMMKKKIIIFVGLAIILYFSPSLLGGYFYNEATAIRNSFPYQEGEIVFEKSFQGKKVVISKAEETTYAMLIEKKWGIFFQATLYFVE
jgi:heme A synthase